MASDDRGRAAATTPPPKAIGLGAPTSMWIYFEIVEIPALIDAIGDELARHGGAARIDGRTVEPEAGVDPRDWRYHVGELQRMLGDVEQAAETRVHGRFDVLWPTVMAHGVVARRGRPRRAARRRGGAPTSSPRRERPSPRRSGRFATSRPSTAAASLDVWL